MYCGNCGTQFDERNGHCPSCGQAVGNPIMQKFSAFVSRFSGFSFKQKLTAGGIALALILVLIFGISSIVSNWGYRGVVNNLFKSIENRDAGRMYSRVMAKYWIDYVEADDDDAGIEWAEDYIEDFYDDVDCGKKIKITYEIRGKRRATKNELEGLENNIYNWTAYYVRDRDEFSISDAYALDIVFTVHGSERTEEFSFNDELLIIKENGKWRKAGGWIKCAFYSNQ